MNVLRELPPKVGSVYVIPEGIERIETKYDGDNFDGWNYIRKFDFPHSFAKVKLEDYTYSRELVVSEKTECVWNGHRDSGSDLFLIVKNAKNEKIAKLVIPGMGDPMNVPFISEEERKDAFCITERLEGISLTSAEGINRYDKCFDCLRNLNLKYRIAINRLVYPQLLSPELCEKYKNYIWDNVNKVSFKTSIFYDKNKIQTFKSLCKLGLITEEEKDRLVVGLDLNSSDKKQIDKYFK